MHAAERVVRNVPRDVRPIGDGLHHRAYLRLGRRVRACAALLGLRRPLRREVAIEVETFERRWNLDRHAVVVLDAALRKQAVERTVVAAVNRIAADQQAARFGMSAPRAVRIFDAHVEHSPIAVDVLDAQAIVLLLPRVRPYARADETPLLQAALRAVWVQPRDDVER